MRQTSIVEYNAKANKNILVNRLFNETSSIMQFNTCSNPKCGQTISGLMFFPMNLLKLYTGNKTIFCNFSCIVCILIL